MSKAQLVITAVVLEGRSKSEVASEYDVSRQWVQQLCKRYEAHGDVAYLPARDARTTARRPPPSRSKTASSCCARP
jgi:transposase